MERPKPLGIRSGRLSPTAFRLALTTLIASLTLAALSIHPHLVTLIAAALCLLVFSSVWEMSYIHTKTNLIPVTLLVMACFPDISSASHEPNGTPAQLIRVMIAAVWFSAGIGKIKFTGWRWSSGEPLRAYLIEHSIYDDSSGLALRAASHRTACRLAATCTLLLEITFPLVLFTGFTRPYLVAAGSLHAASWLLMRIDFGSFFAPAYLAFIPAFSQPSTLPLEPLSVETATASFALVTVLAFIYFALTFRVLWPLQGFPYYSRWAQPDSVRVLRLARMQGDSLVWLSSIDPYQPKWFYYGMRGILSGEQPPGSFVADRALASEPSLCGQDASLLVVEVSSTEAPAGDIGLEINILRSLQVDTRSP